MGDKQSHSRLYFRTYIKRLLNISLLVPSLVTNLFFVTLSFANSTTKIAEPQFVKTVTNPYEQYNDIHPTWSADGSIISFERYDSAKHNIVLSNRNGNILQTISISSKSEFDFDDLLGEDIDSISFNTGVSWAPDKNHFVFTSNGRNNNFDLYLARFGEHQNKRLTFHHQKDSHASWSPDGNHIAFISSRNGWAQLFQFDTKTGEVFNFIKNRNNAFYPVWSPDSTKLAFMQEINNVYQVFIIDDIKNPENSLRQLTEFSHSSVRPSWSSDGRKVAFFHLGASNEAKTQWNIIVLDAMSSMLVKDRDIGQYIIAKDVVLNSETGPTWIPGSDYIAYVKNKNESYNPIQFTDIQTRRHWLLNTRTMLNRDLSCSQDGTLAFQTQDRQWSRIFISKLPDLNKLNDE